MQEQNNHKYDDIIHLEHPVSKTHPQMSLYDRAAQFAPFAALTGHAAARLPDGQMRNGCSVMKYWKN